MLKAISRTSAERKLVENVERARTEFEEAMDQLLLIMSSFSTSGITTDGTRGLDLASARKDLTLQQLRQAVDRLNGFVLYGIIPDDLEAPPL